MIQLQLISVSQVFIQVENRVIELITVQNSYNSIKYLLRLHLDSTAGLIRNVVQVLQPLIQRRKIEYVKLRRIILKLLSRYLKKNGPGMLLLLMVDGEPSEETIKVLVFF
jgi:hypothetical protein